MKSATPASGTNSFSPFRAGIWTASGSQDALDSSIASVAVASPLAIAERCFVAPAAFRAAPARSVEMYGPGTSARPISSVSAASSTSPSPMPPASSGNTTPRNPCSAILRHSLGSCAVSVSMMRRTSDIGHSAAKNLRALFLRICWDSLSPNCITPHGPTLLWRTLQRAAAGFNRQSCRACRSGTATAN